jgi:hypothetical protein
MPQPTSNAVHVDSILTNISSAYVQGAENFIATKVFPVVPVMKQTDKYFVYDKNDFMRDEMKKRADGAASIELGYDLTTATYSCDVWAAGKVIGDQARANADAPLNLDTDAVKFLTQQGLIRRERQWVTDAFATGKWGTEVAGTTDFTKWSDQAGSDPITDIDTGRETILSETGMEPNTLVLGYQTYRALTRHPLIKEIYKYTSSDSITADMLARVFEVDNVYVSRAAYATNAEGGTAAYGFAAGKHALLCYVNPTPSLMMPSAGYTMGWSGLEGSADGLRINRYDLRGAGRPADKIEIEMAFDDKLVSTDLGYFFLNAVA